MAVILKRFNGRVLRLRGVIHAAQLTGGFSGLGRLCREDHCALREIQMHIALQMNRKAEVRACWKHDCTAASLARRFNRRVDAVGIQLLPCS